MTLTTREAGGVEAPQAAPRPPRRPRKARLLPAAAIATGTAAIGTHASFYGNWIIDDAGITYAYARSFAEGMGPVLHPGASAVEGFSNPTWTAILAVGKLVGLFDSGTILGVPDYVLFPKALALLLCAGILAACHVAATRVTRRPWLATLAVGLALAANPSFVLWCFSGLENPLYALVITWLAVLLFTATLDDRLLSRKVALAAGGLAAFAALTRPEGLIYGGAYPLAVLGRLRSGTRGTSIRHILVSTAAFLVPVGAYVTWRLITFGMVVASPSVAKRQGIPSPDELVRPGELVAYAGGPIVIAVLVLVGLALGRPTWWRPGLYALLIPLTLGVVAFAVLEPDWMSQYRFATPVWVLGTLIAVLVTAEALRQARGRGRALLTIGIVAALVPTGATWVLNIDRFREKPDISVCYVADRFGRTFNAYADRLALGNDASLLLPDLGGTAMTSRLQLIDMAGLTHDRFADLARQLDDPAQRDYVYGELEPTFIHSRNPWSTGNTILLDPRLERDYHWIYFDSMQGPPHGDWVRKDAVPDSATLARLREYAAETTRSIERDTWDWPLRRCGDTLGRGQTAVGTE